MYLVACKWIANGDVGYKKPMEYLSSPTLDEDEIAYATAVMGLAAHQNELINGLPLYFWLDTDSGLNKITLSYYNDKETFDQWNNSAPHAEFLNARTAFMNKTGITLQVVQKEVDDLLYSVSYDSANELFS